MTLFTHNRHGVYVRRYRSGAHTQATYSHAVSQTACIFRLVE